MNSPQVFQQRILLVKGRYISQFAVGRIRMADPDALRDWSHRPREEGLLSSVQATLPRSLPLFVLACPFILWVAFISLASLLVPHSACSQGYMFWSQEDLNWACFYQGYPWQCALRDPDPKPTLWPSPRKGGGWGARTLSPRLRLQGAESVSDPRRSALAAAGRRDSGRRAANSPRFSFRPGWGWSPPGTPLYPWWSKQLAATASPTLDAAPGKVTSLSPLCLPELPNRGLQGLRVSQGADSCLEWVFGLREWITWERGFTSLSSYLLGGGCMSSRGALRSRTRGRTGLCRVDQRFCTHAAQ